MRWLKLAVLAIAAASAPAAGQPRLPDPLQAYVANAMAEAEMPGLAVAVVHGDDPAIAQGFGLRRLGEPGRVDADTVFNIASLTKSFTAAAAAILVDEGRLGWNDPVHRWLPQVRFSDPWLTEQISLADLLSHRTGLQPANTMFRLTHIDRAEILRRVRYLEPASPFRTEQVYNNVLYTVAGEVTAAAAGTSWEALIRDRLLEPLGMAQTGFGPGTAPAGNVAAPHAVIGGLHVPIRPASYVSIAPAGGLNSTARDMTRWLRFQLGGGELDGRRLISAEAMQAMHEPWTMIPTTPAMRANRQVQFFAGYGLGWNVMDYRGHKLLWHSGNADGMPSYMALLPERRIGVVVMLNSWKAPYLHGDIASRILDHYLGLPTRDYAAETLELTRQAEARRAAADRTQAAAGPVLPPMDLDAYQGDYRSDLFGTISVVRLGQGLVLKMGEGEEADLHPVGRDAFTMRWRDRVIGEDNDTRAVFALDSQGAVSRLTMQVRRDLVEAVRAEPGR
ncbi:MAG TPA: serine hydrolase [Allosphingosinicella sp.]|nr:serine hydrolase [Allosphingosinicella sp.]